MPSQPKLDRDQRRGHRRQRWVSQLAFAALVLGALAVVAIELMT